MWITPSLGILCASLVRPSSDGMTTPLAHPPRRQDFFSAFGAGFGSLPPGGLLGSHDLGPFSFSLGPVPRSTAPLCLLSWRALIRLSLDGMTISLGASPVPSRLLFGLRRLAWQLAPWRLVRGPRLGRRYPWCRSVDDNPLPTPIARPVSTSVVGWHHYLTLAHLARRQDSSSAFGVLLGSLPPGGLSEGHGLGAIFLGRTPTWMTPRLSILYASLVRSSLGAMRFLLMRQCQ